MLESAENRHLPATSASANPSCDEDVDLIARAREQMRSACEESLLNRLLNEMDGLREDAAILSALDEILFAGGSPNVKLLGGAAEQ